MLFAHCGVDRAAVIERAEKALYSENCEPDVGCVWLSLLVMLYAERFAAATTHCERLLDGPGSVARPLTEVLMLIRARVDAQTGNPAAAVEVLMPMVGGGVAPALRGMALAWLVEALAQVGAVVEAQRLLGDRIGWIEALPDRAHVLAARGALHWVAGDPEASLADYLECGKVLTTLEVANPAVVPWRSRASLVAVAVGRRDLAAALADEELAAARRWGSPGAVGCALHALGMARRDGRSVITLERAVELLEVADARYALMPALCDLGQLYAAEGDSVRSRAAAESVARLADAAGAAPMAQCAASILTALDLRRGVATLTKQEHRIAGLALHGNSNKSIAQTMFLAVRTVEFHLSNVYRKLGISGRSELRIMLDGSECA
ncbi:helix-turn-helix transcriptional regulator [Nocardia salmonicida]|uniref:helix-turn-helix transcriptional regulator n=1 Tax=Nocardia salmonicida TaxID=53431 RepID=UPI00363299B2